MTFYSYEDVVSRIQGIIDVAGADHVYVRRDDRNVPCLYACEGKPDCIVGHLLVQLGIPVEDLEYNPSFEPGTKYDLSTEGIGTHFQHLHINRNISFDREGEQFLRVLQSEQDSELSWGEAFINAQRAARQ